jgi:hypothetical protein
VQTRTNLAAIPINNASGTTAPGVTMTTVGTGTEFGQTYIDVRWQGTASGTSNFLQFTHSPNSAFNPAIHAPVTPGQTYTTSIGFRLVSGTAPSGSLSLRAQLRDNAGNFLGGPTVGLGPATSTLQRGAVIMVAAANAAFIQPSTTISVPVGEVVDVTIRFYAANVEQGIGNARPLLQRNVPETIAAIGDLDAEALLTFVGGGNGFVPIWYDQSGNGRNATQTTAGSQPRIVSNGVIETQNGRATISQSNQNQTLSISAAFTGLTSATGIFVFRQLTINGGAHDFRPHSYTPDTHSPFSNGTAYDSFFSASRQVFNNYGPASVASTNTLTIHTVRQTGTALQLFKNGTQIDSDKTVSFHLPDFRSLFSLGGGTVTLSEAIVFGTALSTTDRQLLERNQGAYYGITVA